MLLEYVTCFYLRGGSLLPEEDLVELPGEGGEE